MVSGMAAGLYEAYLSSMDAVKAQKRTCWHVSASRSDTFFGRWEIVRGTGQSMGPFDTPVAAMQRAIEENNALLQSG